MLPIDFEGTNKTFTKPDNMTDEQCSEIRAYVGTDNDGFDFILLGFQLSVEDLEAVNAGRPIMLKIVGKTMPPVALYTFDENYEPNI